MMKMTPKTNLMLIALGLLVCLLQATSTDATTKHGRELLKTFRRIDFDETRKSIYLLSAKFGVQSQLRDPLMQRVLNYWDDVKLSKTCLDRMVKKVDDVKETFYAGFSYACKDHDQYSVDCLEAAKPSYLTALVDIRTETENCLTSNNK
uniref:Aegyptin/gSG7 salivary protein-like four-helix bundle domain-containing protein n=1 Tax=Anopheles atroparvus TaxID=41427 RepID=A0AAG5D6T2_ANOAO